MHHTPIAAGGSSFDLIDSKKLFTEIQLEPGMTFLDVACGYGFYSIAASKYVGEAGIVYLWIYGKTELITYPITSKNLTLTIFNQSLLMQGRKFL